MTFISQHKNMRKCILIRDFFQIAYTFSGKEERIRLVGSDPDSQVIPEKRGPLAAHLRGLPLVPHNVLKRINDKALFFPF